MRKPSKPNDPNHASFISNAKSRFESHLKSKGKSLGRNDEPILSLLLANHRAFGAYEIVEQLSKMGKRVQAVQVYRSLEKLIEFGAVHKLRTKNAFVACFEDGVCNSQQFFICDVCDDVSEIQSQTLDNTIQDAARRRDFSVKLPSIEILGVCSECANT